MRAEEKLKSFETSSKFELVDLHQAVRDVAQFYEEAFRGKRIDLHIEIPTKTIVKAERSILTNQVLSNLLSNAIKFSRKNGRITISAGVGRDFVSLSVRDQGIGIKKADIARIFFSDTLVSTTGTANEAGMGLGTTLVREYMRKFHGEVVVESVHESESEDSGTVVTLKFPHPQAGEIPRKHSA